MVGSSSCLYEFDGVEVSFPFEAYACQTLYMGSVVRALIQGSNALLESPTGTGKTLCLLCASLAWAQSVEKQMKQQTTPNGTVRPPLILYASRTHSQLQQVLAQLKLTSYRPRMSVLGSRDHFCVHEDKERMAGAELIQHCRNLNQTRRCHYRNNLEDFQKKNAALLDDDIHDIEDLIQIGKSRKICPYYFNVEAAQGPSDLILLPYNYLIDPALRASLKLQDRLQDAVVIVDEAHNLESSCMESASFDLSATLLSRCIREADRCISTAEHPGFEMPVGVKAESGSIIVKESMLLKALLLDLEKQINNVKLDGVNGFTKPGRYILTFFESLKVTASTYNLLASVMENVVAVLGESVRDPALRKLKRALDAIFQLSASSFDVYRVHVHQQDNTFKNQPKNFFSGASSSGRTLSFWCFSSSEAIRVFESVGIRSLILTSGTLSPLQSLEMDLGTEFRVQLENHHVVEAKQVLCAVLPVGPTSQPLNSSYRNRTSTSYSRELGNALVNFARLVPDGLLVFFPSYAAMQAAHTAWSIPTRDGGTNVLQRLEAHKHVVMEAKGSFQFQESMSEYQSAIDEGRGAILFAVCRGKVSEGFDFTDRAARAVVITGLPFAPRAAAKVRLKCEYMDNAHRNGAGQLWYSQQAYRAVNQALGRVIRHRNDYGAILLCDERFAQPNARSQLSKWVQKFTKVYDKFGELSAGLQRFYRSQPAPVAGAGAGAAGHCRVESLQNKARSVLKVGGTSSGTTNSTAPAPRSRWLSCSGSRPEPLRPPPRSSRAHHVLTMEPNTTASSNASGSGGLTLHQCLKERYEAACSPALSLAATATARPHQQQQQVTQDDAVSAAPVRSVSPSHKENAVSKSTDSSPAAPLAVEVKPPQHQAGSVLRAVSSASSMSSKTSEEKRHRAKQVLDELKSCASEAQYNEIRHLLAKLQSHRKSMLSNGYPLTCLHRLLRKLRASILALPNHEELKLCERVSHFLSPSVRKFLLLPDMSSTEMRNAIKAKDVDVYDAFKALVCSLHRLSKSQRRPGAIQESEADVTLAVSLCSKIASLLYSLNESWAIQFGILLSQQLQPLYDQALNTVLSTQSKLVAVQVDATDVEPCEQRRKQRKLNYTRPQSRIESALGRQASASSQLPSCVACLKACSDPHRARHCQHVACHKCWIDVISADGKCPKCFQRVSKKALLKLYFGQS